MGSDEKVLIRVAEREDLLERLRWSTSAVRVRGGWAEVEDLRIGPSGDVVTGEEAARAAARHGLTTVFFSIHSVVDQIWILCFEKGSVVRELRYTADEGWAARRGRPLPWENGAALQPLLRRRDLFASPDGYDVLDAFLGIDDGAPEKQLDVECLPGAALKSWKRGHYRNIAHIPEWGGVLLSQKWMGYGFSFTGCQFLRGDGTTVEAAVESKSCGGKVVGVLRGPGSPTVVVMIEDCDEFKPVLSFVTYEAQGGLRSIVSRKVATRTIVAVFNPYVLCAEHSILTCMNHAGRKLWRRDLAEQPEQLRLSKDGVVAAGDTTGWTMIRIAGGEELPRQDRVDDAFREPPPLDGIHSISGSNEVTVETTSGTARLSRAQLNWRGKDGRAVELGMPGVTGVGPVLGDEIFVRTQVPFWGECWWTLEVPPRGEG